MSTEKINISLMKLSDIDEVCALAEKAYGEHHWSRESFVGELDNNIAVYYVARNDNGELAGYLGTWIILDEAHVTTLAVSEKYKRQKIATMLMLNFLQNCYKKFVKYITLEVRVSNEPAKALYEKFGFCSLGVRKAYYQDNNEDALIMWTENIWHDKYKLLYNKLAAELNDIEVCFES